jgi:beta-glucosidase
VQPDEVDGDAKRNAQDGHERRGRHARLLDILNGAAEPSGLLPMQMPASMKTVEEQLEDVPHDMECHVDSEGHAYDFAYGLGWSGVIDDARTATYKR